MTSPQHTSSTRTSRVNHEFTPPASPAQCEQELSSPAKRTLRSQTKGCQFLQDDGRIQARDKKHSVVIPKTNTLETHSQTRKKNELIAASYRSAMVNEARRMALRNAQAAQDPRKTTHEPDLNNGSEVRHFEVDEYGSLTFILFETMEAWMMKEVPWSDPNNEGTQVVVGRLYRIVKV